MAKSSIRFRDTLSTYERLQSEILSSRFAPVYLLMGEESYFIDRLANLLSTSILSEAERSFSQYTLYGTDSDLSVGKIITLCRQLPMMGRYQVVIVKEAQQLSKIEDLSLYTSNPSPTTILVVCLNGKVMDKRTAFYKWVQKNGSILESVRPYESEIAGWINQLFAQKGCSIDAKAQAMLTEHLGLNLSKIAGEAEKLLVSLPEGTRLITDSHIEENIGISKDFNNFELTKAILRRDMGRALAIADHFAANPKDNPTLLTIIVLFGQFKQLFLLNYLNWQSRRKGIALPPDQELMRTIGCNNFYALSDLKQATTLWPNKKVFAVLGLLREYDARSKGLGAGSISDGELRRELILKILLL